MARNFEPQECFIFVPSTKIGTWENNLILYVTAIDWLEQSIS